MNDLRYGPGFLVVPSISEEIEEIQMILYPRPRKNSSNDMGTYLRIRPSRQEKIHQTDGSPAAIRPRKWPAQAILPGNTLAC